jgi:hypothetical protein
VMVLGIGRLTLLENGFGRTEKRDRTPFDVTNFTVWQGYGLLGLDSDSVVDEAAAGNQGPSRSANRRANVIIFPSDRPVGTVDNRARICDFESGATT